MADSFTLLQELTGDIAEEKNHLCLTITQTVFSLLCPLALCLSQTGDTHPLVVTKEKHISLTLLQVRERLRRLIESSQLDT